MSTERDERVDNHLQRASICNTCGLDPVTEHDCTVVLLSRSRWLILHYGRLFNEADKKEALPLIEQIAKVLSQANNSNAATRMRDLCVAKVKALRDEWWRLASIGPTVEFAKKRIRSDAADDIIKELESLTLEGEQEKTK